MKGSSENSRWCFLAIERFFPNINSNTMNGQRIYPGTENSVVKKEEFKLVFTER